MTKLPFVDKYGKITYSNPKDAFSRTRVYIILEDGTELLCRHDAVEQIFTLPTDRDLKINGTLVARFSTIAYFTENNHPIKEDQTYLIYKVHKTDLPDSDFEWYRIDDILLNKVAFDATKIIGVKHLYVRMKAL